VDGCSVSVFGAPLSGMARAYARLAAASRAGDETGRLVKSTRIPDGVVGFNGQVSANACG